MIHAVVLVDSEARVKAGEGRDTPRNVQNTGRSLERDIIVKNLVPVCVTVPKVLTRNSRFIPISEILLYNITIKQLPTCIDCSDQLKEMS